MKKKIIISGLLILFLAVVLVAADYFGMLGTETGTRLDFAEAKFRIVEDKTGGPVFGTRVKCVQKNIENACTLKNRRSSDILTVLIPKHMRVTKSRFFTISEEIIKPANDKLFIFFINVDYSTVNINVSATEILNGEFKQQTVRM